MDINALSLDELKEMRAEINRAIAGYEDRKRNEARSQLEAAARAMGFSLSEIVGGGKAVRARKRAAVKYRHPEDATLTWTGRGRQPRWVQLELSSGRALSDLLI